MRAIAVACLALAACTTAPTDAGQATALTVFDGDSLILSIDGEQTEVRLIGINAPERDECWGDEARAALGAAVDGRDLRVETDVEQTDPFDRLLVYLWDGDRLVNADLAGDGHVLARAFPPNTRHQDEIDGAGEAARSDGAGLWSGCASASGGGVALDEVAANPPGPDEEALVDEWVAFSSTVDTDLSGWTLRDGSSSNRYEFPAGTVLSAGGRITVRTGCGVDTPADLHWCADGPVWNNDGDDVILLDAAGRTVLAERYGP